MIIFLSLILSFTLNAKKFSNSYIEFDIPDVWHCKSEGGQYVCQPINPDKRKEAIVIMASKYQGPEDTLQKYEERLKTPKKIKDLKNKEYTNDVKYTKYSPINAVPWVDSLQADSEVPGFYTRYLATVHNGVGIAVTFSAHQSKYEEYKPVFYQMVRSIRIKKDIPKPQRLSSTHSGSSALDLGFDLSSLNSKGASKDKKEAKTLSLGENKPEEKQDYMPLIFIAAGAIIVLIILRKFRKK